jgi:hypothetical protein
MDRLDGPITSRHMQCDASNQADDFPVGRVYFLELASQGVIKIGSTVNPAGRMKHLASVFAGTASVTGNDRGRRFGGDAVARPLGADPALPRMVRCDPRTSGSHCSRSKWR